MKKIIQKLFGTTKQAIISTACIMAVIAIAGAGTAYAAAKSNAEKKTSQVFETTETTDTAQGDAAASTAAEAITMDTAKEIALADAGLTADTVTFTKAELDYDDGRIVYDLEFYAENAEYEYEVNANTGAIYSKSKETYAAAGSADSTAASTQITLEEAQEIALADAGVSASEATFTKEKQHYENRVLVYDLEFYTSTGEYEYEIRVSDGTIVSKNVKEYVSSSGSSTASDAYISVDDAKEIALNKAGLSASDVTFKKAKLDRDDGIMVYEIEFYYGRTEYEVKVSASTGVIVEYEVDTD